MVCNRRMQRGLGCSLLVLTALVGCTGPGGTRPAESVSGPAAATPAMTASSAASAPSASESSPAGPALTLPRAVHRATTLADGRILFTGGCSTAGCGGVTAAAETGVFDSASGKMAAGSRLRQPRLSHTATLLDDGRVLLIGGYPDEGAPPTASIEAYDPTSGAVSLAGSLRFARADHTASLLPDGRVLVAGGRGADGAALGSVEIVDPATDRVTDGPELPTPRTGQIATQFGDWVLLLGGTTVTDDAVATTLLLDPNSGRWTRGPSMLRARVKHAAVALPDGGVLVLGGAADVESRERFSDTEVLADGAQQFRKGPELPEGRYKLTDAVAALPDGRVVVAGGPTLEVVDVAEGTVRSVAPLAGGGDRAFQTANLVTGSRVLVAGGYDAAINPTADTYLVAVG